MTHDAAREALARMLYEMACEDSSCKPWEQLGQTTRKKYRRRADLILAKLAEMGYRQCEHLWSDTVTIGYDPAITPYCIKCSCHKPPPETGT